MVVDNFLKLMKGLKSQIQEAIQPANMTYRRYITKLYQLNLLKSKDRKMKAVKENEETAYG